MGLERAFLRRRGCFSSAGLVKNWVKIAHLCESVTWVMCHAKMATSTTREVRNGAVNTMGLEKGFLRCRGLCHMGDVLAKMATSAKREVRNGAAVMIDLERGSLRYRGHFSSRELLENWVRNPHLGENVIWVMCFAKMTTSTTYQERDGATEATILEMESLRWRDALVWVNRAINGNQQEVVRKELSSVGENKPTTWEDGSTPLTPLRSREMLDAACC
ncbi:hypothetical protein C8R43DRAFT_1191100 [Mycena crocata]|nr:hypothetical protein C8R43DRAFT_1191100 [Mycena crocata]